MGMDFMKWEWEETYRKTGRRMKRTAKIIACVIGTIFVMAAILWGGFVYHTKYKITHDALSEPEQDDKQVPPFFDGKTDKIEFE